MSLTALTVNYRVQKHREALRSAGLRPVQIWVPDTRRAEFQKDCAKQSALLAKADAKDANLHHIMDAALDEVTGWTA